MVRYGIIDYLRAEVFLPHDFKRLLSRSRRFLVASNYATNKEATRTTS